jgi:hypothetical protein
MDQKQSQQPHSPRTEGLPVGSASEGEAAARDLKVTGGVVNRTLDEKRSGGEHGGPPEGDAPPR